MWTAKQSSQKISFKVFLEIVQSLVTISAVIVGGVWTYTLFIHQRNQYPHVNLDHKLAHLALSKELNLLRVGLDVSNAGTTRFFMGKTIVRVQQVLPIATCEANQPCASDQVREAASTVARNRDSFSWPLITKRERDFEESSSMEPGEKQRLEFEFVIPAHVRVARVYTYVKNNLLGIPGDEYGWSMTSYYNFSGQQEGEIR